MRKQIAAIALFAALALSSFAFATRSETTSNSCCTVGNACCSTGSACCVNGR